MYFLYLLFEYSENKMNPILYYQYSVFSFLEVTVNPIRVIPQGTVDNKLGPGRLAGPKALDPNYCRQPTL